MKRAFAIRATPTALFVGVFFFFPVGVLFAYSFGTSTYLSISFGHSLANYREALTNSLYVGLLVRSLWVGALVGALAVLISYPLVYAITLGALRRYGEFILFLVIVSLFSAYIVRVYAWRTVLGRNGVLNSALSGLGIIDHPLTFLLYSRFAVVVTLVNVLIPLAVLPLYSALTGVDLQVVEASGTLGASPLQTLRRVVLPLSIRGVIAAFALCFIVAAGDYVTPQLVGNGSSQLLGNTIVQWFGVSYNWPLGSALAFVLLAAVGLTVGAFVVLTRIAGLRDTPR
jgi:spermidine/putrescine transport system permease protein